MKGRDEMNDSTLPGPTCSDPAYKGLHAVDRESFPKRCANCGRVFPTVEAFVRETSPAGIGGRGFKRSVDDAGAVIVELFRNCPCGSTLMDSFSDRRRAARKSSDGPTRAASGDRRSTYPGAPPLGDPE
jgi:hypothetical protein